MRRRYFWWMFLVGGLVLTIYGGYSIIYSLDHQKDIPVLGIVFAVIGVTALLVYFVLFTITMFQKNKRAVMEENNVEEEKEAVSEPKKEETVAKIEEEKPVETKPTPKEKVTYRDETTYERRPVRTSRYDSSDIYVSKVGYGPVLRISDDQILDMRTNTYYSFNGNTILKNGSDPVFEISGNRIRLAFGSYLYEISGDSVNKVFGGYYASFTGGYLQTHDLREKYEIQGPLSLRQKLAVVALLFGAY